MKVDRRCDTDECSVCVWVGDTMTVANEFLFLLLEFPVPFDLALFKTNDLDIEPNGNIGKMVSLGSKCNLMLSAQLVDCIDPWILPLPHHHGERHLGL